MGGRQYRTIGDLSGDKLLVKCASCEHVAAPDAGALYALGMGRDLLSLRFRCSKCGSKRTSLGIEQQPRARHWTEAFKGEK